MTARFRQFHRLSAWLVGFPILLIVSTGILLQIKNWIPWIQPPSQKGGKLTPSLRLDALLKASQSVSSANVREWRDIRSIDIRPLKGIARVRTRSDYEITIDLESERVLQAAPRRTSFLIELHEGSFFGDKVQYGVFLPAAVLLLILWGTGIVLLFRPWGMGLKKQFSPQRSQKKLRLNRGI